MPFMGNPFAPLCLVVALGNGAQEGSMLFTCYLSAANSFVAYSKSPALCERSVHKDDLVTGVSSLSFALQQLRIQINVAKAKCFNALYVNGEFLVKWCFRSLFMVERKSVAGGIFAALVCL